MKGKQIKSKKQSNLKAIKTKKQANQRSKQIKEASKSNRKKTIKSIKTKKTRKPMFKTGGGLEELIGSGIITIEKNDDSNGFLIKNLLSEKDLDMCECLEPKYIKDFFKITQITTIAGSNFATIGEDDTKRYDTYVTSHFIKSAVFSDEEDLATDKSHWFSTYIKWIVYNICNTIFIQTIKKEESDWNIYYRLMLDKSTFTNLSNVNFPLNYSPFYLNAKKIVDNNEVKDHPIENKVDEQCVKHIISVMSKYVQKLEEHNITNFAIQYILLMWYCGAISNQSGEYYCRLEFLLYEFPFATKEENDHNGKTIVKNEYEYIGQSVRYFAFAQVPYTNSSGKKINIPNSLSCRDGHACCMSYHSYNLDQQWLNSEYKYLIGTSIAYYREWHELRQGWYAGFFSAKQMPSDTYRKTFGRLFCFKKSYDFENVTICPSRSWEKVRENKYGYGSDEYVGAFMLIDSNGYAGWQEEAQEYLKEIYRNSICVPILWYHYITTMLTVNSVHYGLPNPNSNVLYFIRDLFSENSEQNNNAMVILNQGYDSIFKIEILPQNALMFIWRCISFQRLVFEYCYHIHRLIFSEDNNVTFRKLRSFMFTINDMSDEEIKRKYNSDLYDIYGLLNNLKAIVPPVYAFFTTLFHNSGTVDHFTDKKYPVLCDDAYDVWGIINDITHTHTGVVFLLNYKKYYSFYEQIKDKDGNVINWDPRAWLQTDDETSNLNVFFENGKLIFVGDDGSSTINAYTFGNINSARGAYPSVLTVLNELYICDKTNQKSFICSLMPDAPMIIPGKVNGSETIINSDEYTVLPDGKIRINRTGHVYRQMNNNTPTKKEYEDIFNSIIRTGTKLTGGKTRELVITNNEYVCKSNSSFAEYYQMCYIFCLGFNINRPECLVVVDADYSNPYNKTNYVMEQYINTEPTKRFFIGSTTNVDEYNVINQMFNEHIIKMQQLDIGGDFKLDNIIFKQGVAQQWNMVFTDFVVVANRDRFYVPLSWREWSEIAIRESGNLHIYTEYGNRLRHYMESL